jgi:hypothetical protein
MRPRASNLPVRNAVQNSGDTNQNRPAVVTQKKMLIQMISFGRCHRFTALRPIQLAASFTTLRLHPNVAEIANNLLKVRRPPVGGTSIQAVSDVACWHFSDLTHPVGDVR